MRKVNLDVNQVFNKYIETESSVVAGKFFCVSRSTICRILRNNELWNMAQNKIKIKRDRDYKVCVKCKKDKLFNQFCRSYKSKDGFMSKCKKCYKKYLDIVMKNNKLTAECLYQEYLKHESIEKVGLKLSISKHTIENVLIVYGMLGIAKNNIRNKYLITGVKLCNRCKKEKSIIEFGRSNDKIRSRCNKCRSKDQREYEKKKIIAEPEFGVMLSLRKRMSNIISGKIKTGSAIKDLGCSSEELKQHLEDKFYPCPETKKMMSWDNYGRYGWHVDHIKPLIAFDLSNRKEFVKACHYTNLQPLWAKENLSKGTKYNGKRHR